MIASEGIESIGDIKSADDRSLFEIGLANMRHRDFKTTISTESHFL